MMTLNGAMLVCDVIGVIESFRAMDEEQSHVKKSSFEKAYLVHRLVMAGLTIAEIGMIYGGGDPKALASIKAFDFLARLVNIPLHMCHLEHKLDQPGYSRIEKNIRLIQGFVGSFSDFVRVYHECKGYSETDFLMQLKFDPDATRDVMVYDPNYPGADKHGWVNKPQPIDPKACEMAIEHAKSSARAAALLRVTMDLGIPAKVVGGVTLTGKCLYQSLADFLRQALVNPDQEAIDPDLLALSFIPHPLHNDEVFSHYRCAITREPIRDPVRDPDGHTLYERSAIRNSLLFDSSSPATKAPMKEADLVEVPGIRVHIDQRLLLHKRALIRFLVNNQNQTELASKAASSE